MVEIVRKCKRGMVWQEDKQDKKMRNSNVVIHQQWPDQEKFLIIDRFFCGTVELHNYHDQESWISGLYVDEHNREHGIATDLLKEAERHARYSPIHIGVVHNAPQWLKDWYMKRGYIIHVEE